MIFDRNVDIDECSGSHVCDPHAFCTNTEGSYTCTCNSGYAGDGKECTGRNNTYIYIKPNNIIFTHLVLMDGTPIHFLYFMDNIIFVVPHAKGVT